MQQGSLNRLAAVSCLALSMAISGVAHAQTAEGQPAESASNTDIVVTATRRAERTVDVPVAVSTLSSEKLDVINSSGQDIRFMSGRVPSLLIESSFGRTFPRFYIRGLGNTDFAADAAQPVSVVYDNIALESPFLKAFPAFDLQNVEVLKGPQGTLFGRNTPAGVAKLTSAKPTDEFTGHLNMSMATYNTINGEAAVSGPISDKLRFRLSGILQRRDDWVKNDYAQTLHEHEFEGYTDAAGRAQLQYVDGPLDILANFHIRSLRGTARVFRANTIQKGTNDFVPGFDIDHVAQDGSNPQRLDSWGTNLQASYAFDGAGTLFSVTGYEHAKVYSRGDIDGGFGAVFAPPSGPFLPLPFSVETDNNYKPEEFTQELRFASEKFGDVSFQAGGYYFNQNLDTAGGSYNLAGAFAPGNTSHLDNETYAVFGSVEYTPIDALILRGGLRWSHDKKATTLNNAAGVLQSSGSASDSNVSWDASATYKLDANHSVYARAATGYLGTSLKNDVTSGIATVATPQTTWSYEIGFKGEERGLISYSADIYYNHTKDMQLTAVGGASNTTTLVNAAKVIGYGAEAELTFTPVPEFVLTAGGSYNFTEIQDPNLKVASCTGGCTVTDPTALVGTTTVALIDGNDLPQAPRWIANLTARYSVPVGEDKEVFLYTDWAYRSSVNIFLYESIEFTGKPFLEGGLRAGYRDNAHGLEVAAFARNITNQIRIIGGIDFNNLTSMVNEPRIIGGEIKYTF